VIVGERVAELVDVADVMPLDQHVCFVDGVAFGLEFLTEGAHHGLRIQFMYLSLEFTTGRINLQSVLRDTDVVVVFLTKRN